MAYELLTDKNVDLSQVGFGDSLMIEFDKEKCYLRVSIFDHDHYQDHFVVDLKDEFCLENLEVEIEEDENDMIDHNHWR